MLRRFIFTNLLFFLAVSSYAEAPPAPGAAQTPQQSAAAAESFVNERLAVWQKRLKLQDWHLTARLVPRTELKPKTLGNINWDTPAKTATIRVLALADYKLPYNDALRDMEVTVVHELVHLQLSSLPRSEASRSTEEHAVNALTEALLNLAGQK
jgi:hypothetical protein